MSRRMQRTLFGLAGALVLGGAACAAFVGGVTGEVLTIVLISGGLAWALLLVFLEIGLGEERDLERERARARRREALRRSARQRLPRRPRRPG